ncbi:MAG: class I SAM-dependent methyltransferase [Planctomycetes bacterium]|nr:class I SAM-dependent methyltransferase [Planctomycetota bacterium]
MKKDKDFLSQIPDWEKDYKESSENEILFDKKDWKSASAKFTEHDLKIFGCAVMEDWETPYMEDLAKVACSNGGVVLELGFGMGISAKFIQKEKIDKHIIIEANKEVVKKAISFSEKAKHKTEVLEGFWEDVIEKIPDESLDGILFDTYPLTDKELYQNHFNFFAFAFKKLKKGGVFTYYSDEINTFGDVHIVKLKEVGFKTENIKSRLCTVNPPVDCEYWKTNTILTPIIIK